MSLDQELTAPPASPPKGSWSEYTRLSRHIKQAGLLERRRGWYAGRIGLNLALFAAGWVAFAVIGESWWQLATAAFLALVSTPRSPLSATTPATARYSGPGTRMTGSAWCTPTCWSG